MFSFQNLKALCQQARDSSISVLIPHTGFLIPPGGQLLHKLYGHFAQVNDIGMSVDGKIIATGTYQEKAPQTIDILFTIYYPCFDEASDTGSSTYHRQFYVHGLRSGGCTCRGGGGTFSQREGPSSFIQ